MGGVNAINVIRGPSGNPLRAKWKSPEAIQSLKRQGKCYRCERRGCSTKICRILPARRPDQNVPAVNVTNLGPIDPNICEEDDDTFVSQDRSEN